MGNKIFLFLCPCCCKHEPEDDNDETNKTETNPYISIIDNEDNNETLKILIKKNKKNDSEVNDGLRQDVLILNVEEKDDVDNSEKIISLGINIGALKTVYSIFSEINGKYVSNVLLMNNSSRIIPSIICYTKSHRLFGDNSLSSLKQNLDTSYNNLSRILDINDENLKFLFSKKEQNKFYCYNELREKEEIGSENIIADYLSLINKYYFEKEKYDYTNTCISVPDFYTENQKEILQIICESIGMKNINIINESTAITMYYGYTKYRDLFVQETNEVDPTIEKNILFIDIGYSKTSFILSYFTYNKFEVKYVDYIPNIGGRNFDELIYNYCVDKFKQENNIEISDISIKMKYRILEEIQKKRIQLTVNNEILFKVEQIFNEKDLNIIIKKEELETIIKDLLDKINVKFDDVIKVVKEKQIKIDYVELAGELMRTPILQKMIENKKLEISKTILIDECTSVGAALLGSFFEKKFPIQKFEGINQVVGNKTDIVEEFSGKKINKNEKENIINHIKNMKEKDEDYNEGILLKNSIQKYLMYLKKLIDEINDYNTEYQQYNDEFNNIKNNSSSENKNKYFQIEKDLNDLSRKIIKKLIDKYENDEETKKFLENILKFDDLKDKLEDITYKL